MSLINFTNLDFDQIKASIRDYLRSNSDFTDYDFEGSNLSVIIDLLAYNTYIASYNANMVTNETFIDSATLRENVVSLARNIGYMPRSKKAAKAKITFFVDTSGYQNKPATLTLKKGLVVTSALSFELKNLTFNLLSDVTVPVIDNSALFDQVTIYEGTYLITNFTVNPLTPRQKYILPNAGIDTDTIRVIVKPSINSTISRSYKQTDTLFGLESTDPVFFVNEIEDERYEIIFGDDVFGKKPEDNSYIEVSYVTTNGGIANRVDNFTFAGKIIYAISGVETVVISGISQIATDEISSDGKAIESVDSIKKYAPRFYSARYRAVTSRDYEIITPRVYPYIDAIAAYGGEDLTPPQYGQVFLAIKPTNGPYLSLSAKREIQTALRQYAVSGIRPVVVDLKYLYVEAKVFAYYNTNFAPSEAVVSSVVLQNIQKYAESPELNTFGARFKYSKFLKLVDDSHPSITSNITNITMRRDLRPAIGSLAEYELCYGNEFHISNESGYNIKTSAFYVSGYPYAVYLGDMPTPTNRRYGRLFLFKLNAAKNAEMVKDSVGQIDYMKGEIRLNPINIVRAEVEDDGVAIIQVAIAPHSNDVIGLQDLYLQIDISNTVVSALPDVISSGADISGSNYIVSSSYVDNSLVRGTAVLATASTSTGSSPTLSTDYRNSTNPSLSSSSSSSTTLPSSSY
jgi:hypothetical protein